MITGSNATQKDYEDYNLNFSDEVSTTSSVIDKLEERRKNAMKGGVNCIPFPFKRFRSEIPGIEQEQYVIITASTKVGKSQLANFLYLYNVLDYCFEHPDRCSCHIIYFALEESKQRIIERYMSHLLYKLDGYRIAPVDLRSTSYEYPVAPEIIELLKSEKYQERFRFFEQCVQFDTENTNPTGILRTCEDYAKSIGTYKSNKIFSHSDWTKEVEVFDDYVQNDPNHYKICIIDHISLVDKEQGFGKKETIDKVSEYFVKYLRNRYKYTCVVIQQQAAEAEGLEAVKQKRIIPSNATGGDGEMGGVCPLFFDGAVCNFEELPRPDDITEINKVYQKVANLKSWKQQKKFQQLSLFNFFNFK